MAENKEVTRYDLMLEKYLIEGISYDANTICKADKADLEQLAADSYWQGWQDATSKPANCAIFDVSQQRELLLAFADFLRNEKNTEFIFTKYIDEFLKANNCG